MWTGLHAKEQQAIIIYIYVYTAVRNSSFNYRNFVSIDVFKNKPISFDASLCPASRLYKWYSFPLNVLVKIQTDLMNGFGIIMSFRNSQDCQGNRFR